MTIPKLEPGARFAEEFRVVRSLSDAPGSAVYVVEQGTTGGQRALKLLDPSLVSPPSEGPEHDRLCQRFEHAAYAATRIESDHVAQVVGAGVFEGTPWMAMELLRGEDLATRIAARGPETPLAAREIVTQLCHALAAAHDVGIVHQDLRPESLFLAVARREGAPFTLKVLQFGLAGFLLAASTREPSKTLEPRLWRAPEPLLPGSVAAPSMDVWALGLLTYFVLTGRPFWRGATSASTASASLNQEIAIEPLPRASERAGEAGVASLLPPGFDEWFGRCVVREPSARFETAREARAAFDTLMGLGSPGPSVGSPAPVSPVAAATLAPTPKSVELEPAAFPNQPVGSPFRYPAPGFQPFPQAPPRATSPFVVLGILAVLLVPIGGGLAGFVTYRHSRKTALQKAEKAAVAAAWSDADSPVPVTFHDPSWGARDAPVTIVEFSDFQCPFCARAETTMNQLRDRYGPEKLRIVWKNHPLPFHPNAAPAAEAAQLVFEGKGATAFWDFHHTAFGQQKSLGKASYQAWAVGLGLDGPSYASALEMHQGRAKVDEDQRLAAKVGAVGTPTFFINGVTLSGAQPQEKFTQIIDEELGKAASKVASGTPKDRVYVELSQASFVEPKSRDARPATVVEDGNAVHNVPVGSSPTLGPASAAVTIVVFSDYQCPFCKRSEITLKQLRETYGKQLRIVWKDHPLPFHPRAVPALNLANEARKQRGDVGFWKVHDLLMESLSLEDTELRRIAEQAGLDLSKDMTTITRPRPLGYADDDTRLAERLHVTGTPRFFINGRSLTGAQPIEAFKKVIDEEIAHAARLVREGVSPTGVYQAILATAVDGDARDADKGDKADGLVKSDLVVGTGLTALSGDKVRVHYVGTLLGGKEFDSSRTRNQPFEVDIGTGRVIKGWDQGIPGMRVGGKRRLTIPPSLAYGERGRPPQVPANSTLVFDIELLEVTPKGTGP